ncbi:hypothetical protein HNQ56_001357 [Anaerotaenia torta]
MSLRYPAVPLITVDPYFSIWSMSNQLNADVTRHWTGKQHRLTGILEIDDIPYCFMGLSEAISMKQESVKVEAVSTEYVFTAKEVTLKVCFMTPLLLEEPSVCARPVTYLSMELHSKEEEKHRYKIRILADDEICLDEKGQWDTEFSYGEEGEFTWGRVGSVPQKLLNKSGDDLRIDWGYLYLAAQKDPAVRAVIDRQPSLEEISTVSGRLQLVMEFEEAAKARALIAIAYDDVKSMEYFGQALDAYWKDGKTPDILTAITLAFREYPQLSARCREFSRDLDARACACGGEEYAKLLALAYRQSVAAHKICRGTEGNMLFISKECFSNGCAATVDVSYPSVPLYLLYNAEFVKGMLRPIFQYASSPKWPFAFAPHDAGQYPLVNGQVYGDNKMEYQMPVEECGNMLIMTTALCLAQKDISYAAENWELLRKWSEYLRETGMDPENQLCTDDFAGHLAHNCNLSIKAIMGITGFSILCHMKGDEEEARVYHETAKAMAKRWITMAAREDGTYRLAFDREDSFSMKYNLVWDKVWGTRMFDMADFDQELSSYLKRSNQFGMPLDNRADYTKSDWLVWCATLMDTKEDFEKMVAPLYAAYDNSPSRVPMTDWYDTKTARMIGFQNRTVQGGLFMRVLLDAGICRADCR